MRRVSLCYSIDKSVGLRAGLYQLSRSLGSDRGRSFGRRIVLKGIVTSGRQPVSAVIVHERLGAHFADRLGVHFAVYTRGAPTIWYQGIFGDRRFVLLLSELFSLAVYK